MMMQKPVRLIALTIALALSASNALAAGAAQEKDTLFAGAEKFAAKAKSSTEVNLDKKLLGLASKFGGTDSVDPDQMDLAKKMDFVIVRSYEYANAGDYKMADVEELSARLDSGGWSHVVKSRDKGESVDVCIKTDNENQISELVVISAEPKELTFVHLKGHLSMDQLMKAGAKYGAPQAASQPGLVPRHKED